MNTFLGLLYAVIITGIATLCVRLCMSQPPKEMKAFVIAAAIIVGVAADLLLLGVIRIPYRTQRVTETSATQLEAYLNTVSPGYTNKVISVEDIQTVLSQGQGLNAYVEENASIGWVAKLIGLKTYTKGISNLCSNAENILQEFKANQTDFTPHNVLLYLQQSAHKAVQKTCERIGLVVFILALVLLGGVLLWHQALLKGWFAPKNECVQFGAEEPVQAPRQPQAAGKK